jgi:hypothetical protein
MQVPSLISSIAPQKSAAQSPSPQNASTAIVAPLLQSPPSSPLVQSTLENTKSVLSKATSMTLGAGLSLSKRLYNASADVVRMFLPPQLGKTIKHTLLWTAGLSAFSFILTGPFHLPALPAFAIASLGFDMAWTFVGGLLRPLNKPYPQTPPNHTFAQTPGNASLLIALPQGANPTTTASNPFFILKDASETTPTEGKHAKETVPPLPTPSEIPKISA